MWLSGGRSIGRSLDCPSKRMTLEVVAPDGRCYLARYEQRQFSGWRLIRCDRELDFLRCCRPQDCAPALRNRGMTFRWLGVPSRQMDAEQAVTQARHDRAGIHQSGMPLYKGQSTNANQGVTNPGESRGKETAAERGSSIITDDGSTHSAGGYHGPNPMLARKPYPKPVIASVVPTAGGVPHTAPCLLEA